MNAAICMYKMGERQAKVRGTYYGVPFTGTARRSRQITTAPYPEELTIALDQPITVFGGTRDVVLLRSDDVDAGRHGMEVDWME